MACCSLRRARRVDFHTIGIDRGSPSTASSRCATAPMARRSSSQHQMVSTVSLLRTLSPPPTTSSSLRWLIVPSPSASPINASRSACGRRGVAQVRDCVCASVEASATAHLPKPIDLRGKRWTPRSLQPQHQAATLRQCLPQCTHHAPSYYAVAVSCAIRATLLYLLRWLERRTEQVVVVSRLELRRSGEVAVEPAIHEVLCSTTVDTGRPTQ